MAQDDPFDIDIGDEDEEEDDIDDDQDEDDDEEEGGWQVGTPCHRLDFVRLKFL